MVDMSPTKRCHAHTGSISLNAHGTEHSVQDNVLTITFTQNHDFGEVNFRISHHCLAHEFSGLLRVFWQKNFTNLSCPLLTQS